MVKLPIPSSDVSISKVIEGSLDKVLEETIKKSETCLEGFDSVILTLKSLGLDFKLVQANFELQAAVLAKVTGLLENLDDEKIKELTSKTTNKFSIMILQAFRAISRLKKPLKDIGIKGLEADINITLPPQIHVSFTK